MELEEIKTYLQKQNTQLNVNLLNELQKEKETAISKGEESLANELWCLITTYEIQSQYLRMFSDLKKGDYDEAWLFLTRIEVSLRFLKENFGKDFNEYNLPFINITLKNYERMFPDYIFMSRESIIKSSKCSICGEEIKLRSGCDHIPGKLYMGELCTRKVTNMKFLGISIVKHPLDKYSILKPVDKEYNYEKLDFLMPNLDSPYRQWLIEETVMKKPEYVNVGRNDKCPCGSGLKYKKCCMNTTKELQPCYNIIIVGRTDIKKTMINCNSIWKDKGS